MSNSEILKPGTFIPFVDDEILVRSVQSRWNNPSFRSYDPRKQRLYLESHVRALLANPEPAEVSYTNSLGIKFYTDKQNEDRYTYPLRGVNEPNVTIWYPQGFGPSCVPWGVTNGLVALGVWPETGLVRQLLNRSIGDPSDDSKAGMTFTTLKAIGETHPDPRYTFGDITTYFSDVLTYARFLKGVFDNSGSVLETVSAGFYGLENDDINHAIAVVGYKVYGNGEMDLTIVDSNQGVLTLSCDFIDRVRTGAAMPIFKTGYS